MESQEKVAVQIFTQVNRDVFLQQIYPEVRETYFDSDTAHFIMIV